MSSASANTTKSPAPRLWSSLTSSDSAFGRLVVGPVLFVSFLLSLFLIDRKASSSVFSSPHSQQEFPSKPRSKAPKEDFYHSHQRKLAKQEFEDAFQLRNKIIAVMVMAGGIGVALVSWTGMRMWSIMSR